MNDDPRKLRHTQKEETASELDHVQKLGGETKEFSSVDELLQHDAKEVVVPPAIAVKLNESISTLPKSPEKPWWKKIFSAQ